VAIPLEKSTPLLPGERIFQETGCGGIPTDAVIVVVPRVLRELRCVREIQSYVTDGKDG